MIEIKDLRVHSFSREYLDLRWSIENHFEDELDYLLQVERSESPEGPFDRITAEFTPRISTFRDSGVNLNNKWRLYWYRLRVHNKVTDEESYCKPQALLERPPLEALEIQRRLYMALRSTIGRKVLIYPVRTTGQRCGACWDKVRGRQMTDGCKTCFGTGFAGGYLYPIQTWMQIDPFPRQNKVTAMLGVEQDGTTTGRLVAYPLLKPGDMIVEFENKRWKVVSVQITERSRSPVRQEVLLGPCDFADVQFDVPVNWDPVDVTPPRNFDGARNLEYAR